MLLGENVAVSEKRSELDAVLHSREFLRSPALAKLLEYLCEKTFSGHALEIKEFSIATEVFGRDKDFGEKRDSRVRVEVHRLRRKLERFYELEGANHPVRIVIRAGNYQPDFERVFDAGVDAAQIKPAPKMNLALLVSAAPSAPAECAGDVLPQPVRSLRSRFSLFPSRGAARALWVILILGVLAWVSLRRGALKGSPPGAMPKAAQAGLLTAPFADRPQPVRILAGSAVEHLTDRFGAEWSGDRYFTGGYQDSLRFGDQERSVPHPYILAAPDQTPFRSFRAGHFSYRIPLPVGKYELRLYFSEVVLGMTDSGDGADNQRIFDVFLNGRPLLTYFDVFSEAGAANTAVIRVFENVSPAEDGFVTLDFRPIREVAWLNAIELIPNNHAYPEPLRIVPRAADYLDRRGQLWRSDQYFLGGKDTSDGKVPSGTADPDLFMGQRYGHFSYRLPVPPGKYRLRLLFAETFFGPDNRGKGGVGSRVFNVYCDGAVILRDFDIFKEAGEDHALEKVFHAIEPNAQGRVELTFEPVTNYALVQGIELVQEAR
jgi:malectin (di-glucose binding ER protein)